MPTYQYRCTKCGHDLEAVQKFTDSALTECPTCSGQLRKVFNAVGVVFKGSGFYRTDSRSAEKARDGGSGDGGSGDKGSGDKGSGEKKSDGKESSAPAKEKAGSSPGGGSSGNGAVKPSGSGSGSSSGSGSGSSTPAKAASS